MSTPEVCVAPRLLIVSCDITGTLVWLHISIMMLTDMLDRLVACSVVKVGTVVGDYSGLAKVMEASTLPYQNICQICYTLCLSQIIITHKTNSYIRPYGNIAFVTHTFIPNFSQRAIRKRYGWNYNQ